MTNDKRSQTILRVVREGGIAPLIQVGISPQTLERVLEHLQSKDKLFDYNVPEEWRDPAREGLQKYLVEVYSQSRFEITGKDAVKKYIRTYDFVAIAGDNPLFEYEHYTKSGMKGVIKSIDHNKKFPLTILWESCDEFPEEQTMNSNGKTLILHPKGFFNRRKITGQVEILAEAEPGRLVEKTKLEFKYSYYLPAGIVGIVKEIDNSKERPVEVIFGNTEGGYIPSTDGKLCCTYDILKLYCENNFSIRELIRENS